MRLLAYHIWNTLLTGFRYLLVSGAMALVGMSLVTGKFPPPVKEFYKNVSQVQSSMDFGKNMANIANAQKQKQLLLSQLEQENQQFRTQATPQARTAAEAFDPYERIKVLEYEVAYLKLKLASARSEANMLKKRQAKRK